jgi:hypothetical protein
VRQKGGNDVQSDGLEHLIENAAAANQASETPVSEPLRSFQGGAFTRSDIEAGTLESGNFLMPDAKRMICS